MSEQSEVENAQYGDWVGFPRDFAGGSVIVPAGTGGMICTDRAPDEMPVRPDCHDVQVDIAGKYYEIEVPYLCLEMQ